MDFQLTDEQIAAREMAHEFAERELRPIALECDMAHGFPPELLCKAALLGLNSMGIPPEYGGAGFDHVTQALIYEELAWGCAGLAATIMGTMLAANTTPRLNWRARARSISAPTMSCSAEPTDL